VASRWKGLRLLDVLASSLFGRVFGKEVLAMSQQEKPSVLKSLTKEEFDALPDLTPEEVRATIARGRESRRTAAAATPHPNVNVKARFR
jgi:hypothetical protein